MKPLFCALAVLVVPVRVSAQEYSPRELAASSRPAVVAVTGFVGGRASVRGTGFLVSADGQFVTNRHVVEDAETLQVELASGEIYDNVYLLADDARRDLVILRIPATGLPHLNMTGDDDVEVGDPVYVMGNPKGWDGTFSSGIVSARRTVDGVSLIQISAPISSGSSGGPVFNSQGLVVAIATAVVEDAQNLNMAIPARYALGLLSIASTPRPFTEVANSFATGSLLPDDRASQNASDDLEPWAQVLLDELRLVQNLADSLGLIRSHEPVIDMLEAGRIHEIEYTFDKVGDVFDIAGVCDIDCTDLDIGVYDLDGHEIIKDVSKSDRPSVRFTITKAGTLVVKVLMRECSTSHCGYALQSFRSPS